MIGKRIKLLRQQLKFKQNEFAEKLSIPQNSLSQYENIEGKTIPSNILEKIIEKTGVNANWLLTGRGEMFGEDRGSEGVDLDIMDKLKSDDKLLFILREISDDEIIKSVLFSLLKSKGVDETSIDKYIKILRAAVE